MTRRVRDGKRITERRGMIKKSACGITTGREGETDEKDDGEKSNDEEKRKKRKRKIMTRKDG